MRPIVNCPLVRLKAFPRRPEPHPATARSTILRAGRLDTLSMQLQPAPAGLGAPPDEPPGRPPQGHHHGVGNSRLPDRRRAAGSVPAIDPERKGPAPETGGPSLRLSLAAFCPVLRPGQTLAVRIISRRAARSSAPADWTRRRCRSSAPPSPPYRRSRVARPGDVVPQMAVKPPLSRDFRHPRYFGCNANDGGTSAP